MDADLSPFPRLCAWFERVKAKLNFWDDVSAVITLTCLFRTCCWKQRAIRGDRCGCSAPNLSSSWFIKHVVACDLPCVALRSDALLCMQINVDFNQFVTNCMERRRKKEVRQQKIMKHGKVHYLPAIFPFYYRSSVYPLSLHGLDQVAMNSIANGILCSCSVLSIVIQSIFTANDVTCEQFVNLTRCRVCLRYNGYCNKLHTGRSGRQSRSRRLTHCILPTTAVWCVEASYRYRGAMQKHQLALRVSNMIVT